MENKGHFACPVCDGTGRLTGLCQCGCGQRTTIIKATDIRRGEHVGFPRRFVNGHQRRRIPPTAAGFWSQVEQGEGCWEWQGTSRKTGYGVFGWVGKRGGRSKHMQAHRLAYELAVGPIPEGMFVCHHCDNRKCVRPDHLFLGDNSDNMQDMWRKGRGKGFAYTYRKNGLLHPRAKLNRQAVLAARHDYEAGISTLIGLARQHNVQYGVMWNAVTGRTWSHVDGAVPVRRR